PREYVYFSHKKFYGNIRSRNAYADLRPRIDNYRRILHILTYRFHRPPHESDGGTGIRSEFGKSWIYRQYRVEPPDRRPTSPVSSLTKCGAPTPGWPSAGYPG